MIWVVAIIATVVAATKWGAFNTPRPPKHIREEIERNRWTP